MSVVETTFGSDVIRTVDATSGNEIVYLPPNFATNRKITVRRVDSSANTVTVRPGSAADSLNGTMNGTTTVPGGGEKSFLPSNPGTWLSFGGGPGGSGGLTGSAGTTLTTTSDLVTDPSLQAAFTPALLPKLRRFHAALGNVQHAPVNIVSLGDSITEGMGASAVTGPWIKQLGRIMRSRFPGASANPSVGGVGFVAPNHTGTNTYTWPTTLAGAPGADLAWGPKRNAVNLGSAGQSVTYSITGTSADIMYAQGTSTGSLNYVVDGGAPQVINTNNATLLGGRKTRVSLGTAGPHTLVVGRETGINFHEGIDVYNGDELSGIRTHDCGRWGWDTGTTGWTTSVSAPETKWARSIAALKPDLLMVALGANDSFRNLAPASYKTNLTTIMNNVKTACTAEGISPSILLLGYFERDLSTKTYAWSQYMTALQELADGDANTSFLNLTGTRMPNVVGDTLGLYADDVHPNNRGHGMIANFVASNISPR